MVMSAPVMVPGTVMAIIMIVPVIMIPIVVMPVMGSPGAPVPGIVPPVPGRSPNDVSRMVNIPDHRPGGNIIIGRGDHIGISGVHISGISRIRRFSIDGFHNIVRSVESLIPDQLDLHRSVPQFFHHEDSNILLLVAVQCRPKDDGVYISIDIIRNRYIINQIISVQVQVINHGLLIVQAPLKSFQGL
jgi:hypothetical protein